MDENIAHNSNNIVLQFEEDPSLEAAGTKHVTPNEPNIRNSARFSFSLHKAAAELIGTFFLVFVGGIVCVDGHGSSGDISVRASAALTAGMIVMLMIFSTGRISGAHLNPAVTLGFATAGLFPWTQVGELGGIFLIGTTVALLGFIAGPLSGSLSMNPARSIGPALVMMRFKSLHIFIIGPVLGATFSGLIYGMICSSNLDSKSSSTSLNCFNHLFTSSSEHCKR